MLSRSVAESGLYPAIDVEASVSRVVNDITDLPWRERIRRLKQALSAYNSHRDLIAIGAYQSGSDPQVDAAIILWPAIRRFLAQEVGESADLNASRRDLAALFDTPAHRAQDS